MIITPPNPHEVSGHAAEMYQADRDGDGFVYQHTQAMALNPEAHAAFETLVRAVVPSIGLRVYERATLGAARAIRSDHCLLAHGRKALRAGLMDDEQLRRVAVDYRDAGLTPSTSRSSTTPKSSPLTRLR